MFEVLRPQNVPAWTKKKTKKKKGCDNGEGVKRRRAEFFFGQGATVEKRLLAPPNPCNERDRSRALRVSLECAERLSYRKVVNGPRLDAQNNAEQALIVEAPVDHPHVVFAGAGTGKTRTIVSRVSTLCRRGIVSANSMLLLTFSRKACEELSQRISLQFSEEKDVPRVKTFHGVAFSWISVYYEVLGYKRRPAILCSEAIKRRYVVNVVSQKILQPKRLERCRRYLKLGSDATWMDVIAAFERLDAATLQKLKALARDVVMPSTKQSQAHAGKRNNKVPPLLDSGQRTLDLARRTTENEDKSCDLPLPSSDDSVLENAIQAELRRRLYMFLYSQSNGKTYGKDGDADDLAASYLSAEAVNGYLKMMETGKRRRDVPEMYLPVESLIWRAYEEKLVADAQVTFDIILEKFLWLLRNCDAARRRFEATYRLVVVDEFQDNNQTQSDVLYAMLAITPRIMVVGDDDQTIYGFSGAYVGNFERFYDHCRALNHPVGRFLLTLNYRCSKNILAVGGALLGASSKKLEATKSSGDPVRLVECDDEDHQFDLIVRDIQRMCKTLAYSDVSVLFRCFKAGKKGILHKKLQNKLSRAGIPFVVIGSTPLLEQKLALDIQAYLSLATGPESAAFARVLNEPARRLPPQKVLKILDQEAERISVDLEGAARSLIDTKAATLTQSLRNALQKYVHLLDEIRRLAYKNSLTEFLQLLWDKAGFAAKYQNTTNRAKEDEEASEDEGMLSGDPVAIHDDTSPHQWPAAADAIRTAAEGFEARWLQENHRLWKCDGSLFTMTTKYVRENESKLPKSPTDVLPNHLLDLLGTETAKGPTVISSFLASLTLQTSDNDQLFEGPEDHELKANRVVISTIHRAKGLEWRCVFVPYFVEGLMPCEFRHEEDDKSSRHLPECQKRLQQTKTCGCFAHFHDQAKAQAEHFDEERRLAHVAATRAKDWLTFYKPVRMFGQNAPGEDCVTPSRFENSLRQLISFGVVRVDDFASVGPTTTTSAEGAIFSSSSFGTSAFVTAATAARGR